MRYPVMKIGHRGARGHVAENTIESIKKALEFGVDAIEIDVHVCASGELVVFHDFTLDRVTDGSGDISKFTLTELKALKVDHKFRIPALKEVMDVLDKRCFINIELKGKNTPEAVSKLVNFYVNHRGWSYRDILISSFQHELLTSIREQNSRVMLGVLTDTDLDEALLFGKQLHAESVNPDYTMLTKEHVSKIKAEGFKVYTWTVNEEKAIRRIKLYGVDGIISDFPDRL